MNKPETLELAESAMPDAKPQTQLAAPTPISILDKAISGGVTPENVAVVKELMQMHREQRAEEAKAAFARAFFQLRKNMPEIHADKQAKDRQGNVTFVYCSEGEISKMLEPHLMKHGFAMLFGQEAKEGQITVNITLMHELGHSETRTFSVRAGAPNAMKDAAMCDAGAATTAWRHLVTKMFGLKSRIDPDQDAAVQGEYITPDKAIYLRELVNETGSNEAAFLKFAQAASYEQITERRYDELLATLRRKQNKTNN